MNNKAKMVKLTHNNSKWKVNGRKRLKLDPVRERALIDPN